MNAKVSVPRATLLVLTYNQERFVAATIRSALAQDYSNLQIIISDDCSPDHSYQVARRVLETYQGEHDVLARQPARNLGLVSHLYDAVDFAEGELIVVSGGDDLSYPHRVRRLIEAWQDTGAAALCSGWDIINYDGSFMLPDQHGGRSDLRFGSIFPKQTFTQIIGATAAYTPAVFQLVSKPDVRVFAEDLYMSLKLHWLGERVWEVPEPLIGYRQHDMAMTNVDRSVQSLDDYEAAVRQNSGKVAALLEAFDEQTQDARQDGERGIRRLDRSALLEEIAYNRQRARWDSAALGERLSALLRHRDWSHLRWMLPRMFGLDVLRHIQCLRKGPMRPPPEDSRWSLDPPDER